MSGFLASKVAGVVREPLIGRTFGISPDLDAYYAAFNIPDLLFTVIAGGALASVFIPLFTETLTRRGRGEAWQMASAVINLVLLVTLGLAVVAGLSAPSLVACCIAPGFSPEQQALTVELMRLILVSTIVFALAGVLMGILNAQQHFASPAFAPALYNLGIIGGAIFLAPYFGIYGLAYGVIIGSCLHLSSHFPPLVRRGIGYRPVLRLRDPVIWELARLMGPRIAALGLVEINQIIATSLASRLGTGSVSSLNFAWLVMQLPETIIGTAIATAVFPSLSQYAAQNESGRLRGLLVSAIRSILVLTVPAFVGLMLLGRPLVQVLFEGGRFGPNATDAVVWALNFYALGLLGHSLLEVGARVFYAQKDTVTPLLAAGFAMVLNAVLAVTLVNVLAHGGIALANSLAVSIEVGLLLWVASRRLGGIRARTLRNLAVRAAVAGCLMGGVLLGFDQIGLSSPTIRLGAGGAAAGVYFASMWLFGVEEVRAAFRKGWQTAFTG